MPVTMILRPTLLSLCVALLCACKPSAEPAADASPKAVAAKADDSACANRAPSTVAEYERLKDIFFSAPGLTPGFEKGALFNNQQPFTLTYDGSAGEGLSYQLYWLADCAVFPASGGNINAEGGSSVFSGTLSTSTAGSEIADGTPAILEITAIKLLPSEGMTLPKAVQTKVGEYLIRINPPKD